MQNNKKNNKNNEQVLNQDQERDRIVRAKELITIIGVSKATLYNYLKQGKFPPQSKINGDAIGTNSAVGWRLSVVNKWLESRG